MSKKLLESTRTASAKKIAIAAPDNSDVYGFVKEEMTEIINKEMEKSNAIGLSIALVDDQSIVWKQGFGYQDEEKKIPATENTIYQVGSITKLFTVLATMRLAEQGKLDIDQPLQEYLPEFSIKSCFASNQPITARTIMTHHSGIPSEHLKGCMFKPYSSLVKDLQDEYVAFPPNYIFSYSNAAFTLLGHTIATMSKKEYPDYIQDELLRPIGMQHSFVANFPSADNPLMSKNYSKGQEDKAYPLRDIPAGGLCSNVDDMAKFMQMIFAGGTFNGQQVLKSETIAETLRPQNEKIPLDFDFRIGLGWVLSGIEIPGYVGSEVWHNGSINDFYSELIILPEAKLGVVVLGNYEELVAQVRQIAKKTLELAWKEKSKMKISINKDSITAPPNLPSSSDLLNYVGYYSIMGELGKIVHENSQFFLKTKDDNAFCLDKNNDGSYSIKNGPKFFFHTIDGWNLIIMQSFVRILYATKITPLPLSAGSESLCGDYKIVNHSDLPIDMDDIIIVKIKDGFLTMAYKDYAHPDYDRPKVLRAVSDTEWVIDGLGKEAGETIIFKMINGEQYLVYSGLQYIKIKC
jgi:CubicO group peptidase (beta-lactamase class C family)